MNNETKTTNKSGGKNDAPKETPLMRQYNTFKNKYPDAILLFRVGDFYETFGQDAVHTSKALGITLTKRHNGAASETELAGFPHHALETYLPKLVKAGYRVAICDQLEDPKQTQTIVKRGVTELITPGVALGDAMLDTARNNFLAGVYYGNNNELGVAFTDVSTGEFMVAQGNIEYIDKLLQSFQPAEVLYPKPRRNDFSKLNGNRFYAYELEDWIFSPEFGRDTLQQHFAVKTLKGFGLEDCNAGVAAAGALIYYLRDTQHPNLQHISGIARLTPDRYVWLDKFTIRNLELLQPNHPSGKALIDILDQTITPMGSRLLKKWVVLPLRELAPINARLNMVETLVNNPQYAELLATQLKQIGDIERLVAKIPLGRVNPRQIVQLHRALLTIPVLRNAFDASKIAELQKIADQLNPCTHLTERIGLELLPDPPAAIGKADTIATGVNAELDELRLLKQSGENYLLTLQQREIDRTGIASLKIGFNNVFGYYLEVRNKYKDEAPADWIRKQTLANAERYITPELKEYEDKILGAETRILELENKIFADLVAAVAEYIQPLQHNATIFAKLDALLSFATISQKYQYCKPTLTTNQILQIEQGRHPVIEQQLALGEAYVPNDVYLDTEQQQILIITGPNMAGKSALLRQTGLIVLMAQMGSFVPAASAKIGLVDKVFTRVGASDNLSGGESTFMVEMTETASIMNNLSANSLILLDEIGRGTSTYDGISIAWALAEYLHNHPTAHAKTLFATHYHELTELADNLARIKNFSVATKELGNKVVFLRKLVPGSAQRSFGIHVAKMAGMPTSIVQRANAILAELEQQHVGEHLRERVKAIPKEQQPVQLSFFDLSSPQWDEVKRYLDLLDLNTITPIEALIKLN